ncbi:hypothetical protein [Streptomyces paludis]|uniref:Uncharacterized protein n=1 Tax=Streptomyces paludis TaxID=2282738 RepID=A0A345HWT7_9ACTN|nr:hypothetical protein [Streptomyces paludis]AXG81161.1 hypothetical protein DVK44_29615 [Streptomyces paludis]
MAKILSKEPDPGSQVCGYEITVDGMSPEYCGELKALGLYYCRAHHERVWIVHGYMWVAPGTSQGLPPLAERPVPAYSGEAAIYSVAYLTRREGNALRADPYDCL